MPSLLVDDEAAVVVLEDVFGGDAVGHVGASFMVEAGEVVLHLPRACDRSFCRCRFVGCSHVRAPVSPHPGWAETAGAETVGTFDGGLGQAARERGLTVVGV